MVLLITLVLALAASHIRADNNDYFHKLSRADLKEGIEAGNKFVREMNEMEAYMYNSNHEDAYSKFKPFVSEAVRQSKIAAVQLVARQTLSKRFGIPAEEINFAELDDAADRQNPLPTISSCNASYPYRSFDGTCNNLNNPRYGQANTIFQRLMGPATYSDGISTIRRAESGAPLPSTRLISTTVTVNESVSDTEASLITMQWGQFLDHDLTQAPVARTDDGKAISCCVGGRFGNTTASPHPECLQIPIPSDDPVYSNANCMNVVRSTYGLNLDGTTPSSRQQINALTHWIDGSQIYGNNDADAQFLRDLGSIKGLMKVSIVDGRVMLPVTNTCCSGDPTNSCPGASSCFVAGDSRVKEQPLLTILHTLWLREHNRVANQLFTIFGTSKSGEFYYQEARRIVIAEFQHITYNEYLPVVIGPLSNLQKSPNQNNPALYNEFVAAAFRLGHSQVRSYIRLYEANGSKSLLSYFLADSFNSVVSRLLTPKFIDNALRGLLRTQAQSVDECFADDLTSQLFRAAGFSIGGDLISINMQRGRDHGLPPYVIARSIALGNNNPLPSTFDDLSSTHSPEVINSFKLVYESVRDIDLYIGAVTEKHLPGALVGPTFAYIIKNQFQNLMNSDRFFYSDTSKSVSFDMMQVKEIRKASLARIICDNSDGTFTSIQPNAFLPPTGENLPVPCDSIEGIDFNQIFNVRNNNNNGRPNGNPLPNKPRPQ